ncbi:MAG: DNA helicase RecQ [Planctomycetota bacterium]|nr:DNA helicase RecQ [Planctomycetota bacterium]
MISSGHNSAQQDEREREVEHALGRVLKSVFGYDSFRPLQREIMLASIAGRDAVAVLPTGAGKSLCYQLPALVREGLTVVASPLIALMKDQVDQMQAAGVAATFINSTLESDEFRARCAALDRGEYRVLYVAPERLVTAEFIARLARWKVAAIAVDEAHCISEWGHDFRPEYRQIRTVRRAFPHAPVLALTATATPGVRDDIAAQLELRDPAVFVASFDRPNLTYRVVAKDDARAQTLAFIRSRGDDSGIVYCQSRKAAEAIADALEHAGISARPYHAGLAQDVRARNQEAFLRDEVRVVAATIAFGMGINKPNVRFVVHADLPKNIEGYYQETGRAGRDGIASDCLLLYSRGDVAKHLHFLNDITDDDARAVAKAQLDQIVAFAESASCRRTALLGYFGETRSEPACGGCDNCLTPRETELVTTDAQKLMSCVLRIEQKSGFRVGLQHLSEVLAGADTEKIRRWFHNELSTYGAGKDRPRAAWVSLGRQLLQEGYLEVAGDGFAVMRVTERGLDALRQRSEIRVTKPIAPVAAERARERASNRGSAVAPLAAEDLPLFDRLRALRKRLADARGVPPYVVFSDVTLRALATSKPQTKDEFLAIVGIGEKKYADFGADFAAEIAGGG